MNCYKSKNIVITGASSGIGAQAARQIAALGARVILLARTEEKLQQVAESIRKQGGEADIYPVDLSDSAAVEVVAQKIKKEIGIPDVLINNAGSGRWLSISETSADEAKKMIELPYLAAFNITREFIEEMRARGDGHIINLTSVASFLPTSQSIGYSAARYALRGFSEALRSELLDSGVVVSLAVFGKVASDYWEHNPGSEERVPKATPFMPTLSTEDVANELIKVLKNKRRIVIKPGIFRLLFWLHRNFPDVVSKQMR